MQQKQKLRLALLVSFFFLLALSVAAQPIDSTPASSEESLESAEKNVRHCIVISLVKIKKFQNSIYVLSMNLLIILVQCTAGDLNCKLTTITPTPKKVSAKDFDFLDKK